MVIEAFTNIITLSFISFVIGVISCVFIYVFRTRQDLKEKRQIVLHYEKVREVDSSFIEKEFNFLKDANDTQLEYFKHLHYNFLTFLKVVDIDYTVQKESKVAQVVRNYISVSLITLYCISILALMYCSTKYGKEVYIIFLNSSILTYLIQLISMIVSFNLTQKILFSSKDD